MANIEEIIKVKKYLVENGFNLNKPFKPFKVAELMAEYKVKNCSIPDVVGQSEQLFAFGEHLQEKLGCFLSTEHLQQEIDSFKGK